MATIPVSTDIDTLLLSADKTVARGFLGVTPTSVVDNAAKLALTGIPVGTQVNITGEAGRIEQFKGGDITLDDNWDVLRNTINLTVFEGYGVVMVIEGVEVLEYMEVHIGWVPVDRISGQYVSGTVLNKPWGIDQYPTGSPTYFTYNRKTFMPLNINPSTGDFTIDLTGLPDRAELIMTTVAY